MGIVELEGVSKTYGRIAALRNVTLGIQKGVFGLIGPNGAGKSSIIKVILGLVKADSGLVRVFGKDPWTQGVAIRSRIGVLHEKPEFPHWVTGYQLARLVAEFKKVGDPDVESRVLLRRLGLANAMHRQVSTYSAGMVQRLGLAQALMGNPSLVILDEPTSNLDPDGRREVLQLVQATHEDIGTSFFLSSHVLPELQRVCSHVAIMDQGQVLEEGELRELTSKYSLWTRKIKCEKVGRREEMLKFFKGASDLTVSTDSVTVRSSSKEWLDDRIDRLISSEVIRPSDIEETSDLLEQLYTQVLTGGGT